MKISSRTTLALLLALPPVLAGCDAAPPLAPDSIAPESAARYNKGQENKAENSRGLFRVESPMFPFYSRTELPPEADEFGYRTDEWAAIVFYRNPACVPTDFNLFQFYDFNFGSVFSCPPTVDGFALHVEPAGVTPPKHSNLYGNTVPVWFVPWDAEFQQAVSDGSLTIVQLEAMEGLVKGVATEFRETLGSIEFHPVPKIHIAARGYILPESGGGSFRYNVNWTGVSVDDIRNVKIEILQ